MSANKHSYSSNDKTSEAQRSRATFMTRRAKQVYINARHP